MKSIIRVKIFEYTNFCAFFAYLFSTKINPPKNYSPTILLQLLLYSMHNQILCQHRFFYAYSKQINAFPVSIAQFNNLPGI